MTEQRSHLRVTAFFAFMTDLLLAAVILALLAFIAWRESLSFKERAQLVDRLMARSLPEYKDNQTTEPNEIEVPNPDVLDLDDAKQEIVYGPEEDE